MDFRVLGPLEVAHCGRSISVASARERTLLALLVVNTPQVVSRDRLVDELWGARPPSSAAHAIQVYVSNLRKALRSMTGDGQAQLVVTRGDGYALDVEPILIDACRFERLLETAHEQLADRPAKARATVEDALGLWRGSAYDDVLESEVLRQEAARLDELRLVATECVIEARLACGEAEQLVELVAPLVAEHDLRERPLRLLMLALYRSGRQADALAAYQRGFHALDELGLQPGPQLRDLERAILAHDEKLAPRPPADGPSGQHNLPAPPTALIGRAEDIRAVTEMLDGVNARLVTITGAPGIGKTRLALAIAEQLTGDFDVVHLVTLAAVRDHALVAATVAAGLGAEGGDDCSAVTALIDVLRSRTTLLVLDNFEHLLRAAHVVSEVLARSPTTRVLVTSRAPLRLSAERAYPLRPLRTPDPASPQDAAVLGAVPAAALFLERARAAKPGFAVAPEVAPVIAGICARLDGLPLAIELAAARLRILPPSHLLAQLDRRLELLTGGAVDLPVRQQTLRATLDWSYQLLTQPQRSLLIRLAVFVGGFTLTAVEETVADGGLSILDDLAALVDNGLLAPEDASDDARFMMLETIREYARERFAADPEHELVQGRHARHYLAVAEARAPPRSIQTRSRPCAVTSATSASPWSGRQRRATQRRSGG